MLRVAGTLGIRSGRNALPSTVRDPARPVMLPQTRQTGVRLSVGHPVETYQGRRESVKCRRKVAGLPDWIGVGPCAVRHHHLRRGYHGVPRETSGCTSLRGRRDSGWSLVQNRADIELEVRPGGRSACFRDGKRIKSGTYSVLHWEWGKYPTPRARSREIRWRPSERGAKGRGGGQIRLAPGLRDAYQLRPGRDLLEIVRANLTG